MPSRYRFVEGGIVMIGILIAVFAWEEEFGLGYVGFGISIAIIGLLLQELRHKM